MAKNIELIFEKLLPESVKFSLKEELSISENIDNEVDKAAHLFGFYAVLAEKAESRYQRLDFAFGKWVSQTKTNETKRRELSNIKKLTKDQLEDFVKSQPMCQAYKLNLIKCDNDRRILRSIAKAVELRCSLVQTKAANRRREH